VFFGNSQGFAVTVDPDEYEIHLAGSDKQSGGGTKNLIKKNQ
jgi:hypothetical protein